MNMNKRYKWNASEMALTTCSAEIITFKNDCNSYITSVVKETNASYMICASSAKKSVCRMLLLDNDVSITVINDVIMINVFNKTNKNK